MGDHQERCLRGAAQFLHQVLDALGGMVIEVAGWLIEHHQPRTVDQGPSNRHPLAFTAGQLGGLVAQAMAQANPLEQCLGALARLRDGGAADQQRHAHVLQGGELRQ
ncbi:hypothetical protein D3C81_1062480 [compost metagenome]